MPFYHKQGKIPAKRHTAFKKEDGRIYYEELVSREGFYGMYSTLYHLQRPTKISKVGELIKQELFKAESKHRARHITTAKLGNSGDSFCPNAPILQSGYYYFSCHYYRKHGVLLSKWNCR